MPLFRQY